MPTLEITDHERGVLIDALRDGVACLAYLVARHHPQPRVQKGYEDALEACQSLRRRLQEEAASPRSSHDMLMDLLAVIHRDGGHRADEVGVEGAWREAVARVVAWIVLDDATPKKQIGVTHARQPEAPGQPGHGQPAAGDPAEPGG